MKYDDIIATYKDLGPLYAVQINGKSYHADEIVRNQEIVDRLWQLVTSMNVEGIMTKKDMRDILRKQILGKNNET